MKNQGYVYYDRDCFNSCNNPYIPADFRIPLWPRSITDSLKERDWRKVVKKLMDEFGSFLEGYYDKQMFQEYYSLKCDDVQRERVIGQLLVLLCFGK